MKFLQRLVVFATVYLSSFIVFISYRDERYSDERIREFLKLDLLTELPQSRKEFHFSITPWKIDAKQRKSPNVSLRHEDVRWSLVVFVKSHSSHRFRRQLARMTWSSFELVDGVRIEAVFIVGNPQNEQEKMSLANESKRYGDLLQIDLTEKYKSIGIKTIAGMQYAAANFPSDWIYASCDDDIIPDWIQFIGEYDKLRNGSSERRYYQEEGGCSVEDRDPILCGFGGVRHALPKRDVESKWYLSTEEYPLPEFPSYCFGGFYAMTVQLASELYQLSRKLTFFWVDDVWITGFLRLKRFYNPASSCQAQGSVGLWSDSHVAYSSTGTESELLVKWTDYVAKIHEKQFTYANQKSIGNKETLTRYDWDAWLDYVLPDRPNLL